eukprot:Hpha_TRINITY_DN14383_c0_g1::TRINITY_DN14383_c0_g1_i2::g.87064::m.87064
MLRVPAKVLLILATSVSTIVSFTGGFVLYLEGLAAIREGVQETALSESSSAQAVLQLTMDEVVKVADQAQILLRRWQPFRSPEDFAAWRLEDAFSRLKTSPSIYGLGTFLWKEDDMDLTYSEVWGDPLTDPKFIEQYGGDRAFVQGVGLPGMARTPCENESVFDSLAFCISAYSLDADTGDRRELIYDYPSTMRQYIANSSYMINKREWAEKGYETWDPPYNWKSIDDTNYLYSTYTRFDPIMTDAVNPLLNGTMVVHLGYITYYHWPDILRQQATNGYVLAVSGEQVFARSSGESIKKCESLLFWDDFQGDHPCIQDLSVETESVRQGIRILSTAPDGKFMQKTLDGEDYWLIRRTIFKPSPTDSLKEIYLAWLRPTSSVEDKVRRSLFFFIGFIGAVLIFDILVVTLEILKIGQPLAVLKKAIGYIDELELDRAEELLTDTQVGNGIFVISDIQALTRTLRRTLVSLGFYRDFLPQAVLPAHDDSDEEFSKLPEVHPFGENGETVPLSICFTDIQSSTELWEEYPQGMYEALRTHNAALRTAARLWRGYEVKTIGDAFMFVFGSPRDALGFALRAQVALTEQDWPRDLMAHPLCRHVTGSGNTLLWSGLRVRIGIHQGEVRAELNPVSGRMDYFGTPVNIAARAETVARKGGMVVLTQETVDALDVDTVSDLGGTMSQMGKFSLKGISGQMMLHLVLPSNLVERRRILRERVSECKSDISSVPSVGDAGEAFIGRSSLPLSMGTCATVRVALCNFEDPVYQYTRLLTSVGNDADRTQGVILAVLSSSVIVVWNTSIPCSAHVYQSAQFTTRSAVLAQNRYVGIVSGPVRYGNLRSARRRHAVALGGCVDLSLRLAEEAETGDFDALMVGQVAVHFTRLGAARRVFAWCPANEHRFHVWVLECDKLDQEDKWNVLRSEMSAEPVEPSFGDEEGHSLPVREGPSYYNPDLVSSPTFESRSPQELAGSVAGSVGSRGQVSRLSLSGRRDFLIAPSSPLIRESEKS